MTIYSLEVLLSQFGSSLFFHVWFYLLLLNLHSDFSGGGQVAWCSHTQFLHKKYIHLQHCPVFIWCAIVSSWNDRVEVLKPWIFLMILCIKMLSKYWHTEREDESISFLCCPKFSRNQIWCCQVLCLGLVFLKTQNRMQIPASFW